MENKPIVITNVSSSYFSVARHYGGTKIQNTLYVYFSERDVLVRADWEKFYRKMEWNDFLAAVKTGVKPQLPKKQKDNKTINPTPSLFD